MNIYMLSTVKSTDVRSRIEPDLKHRASLVLAECGLNLSDAIRLFLRQVVAQEGLPFEIRTPVAVAVAAMADARRISKGRFASAKELLDGLEKTSATKARKPTKKTKRLRAIESGAAKPAKDFTLIGSLKIAPGVEDTLAEIRAEQSKLREKKLASFGK